VVAERRRLAEGCAFSSSSFFSLPFGRRAGRARASAAGPAGSFRRQANRVGRTLVRTRRKGIQPVPFPFPPLFPFPFSPSLHGAVGTALRGSDGDSVDTKPLRNGWRFQRTAVVNSFFSLFFSLFFLQELAGRSVRRLLSGRNASDK